MIVLDSQQPDFSQALTQTLGSHEPIDVPTQRLVDDIIARVRREGDAALLHYSRQFDQLDLANAEQLEVTSEQLDAALASLPQEQVSALKTAIERVTRYHERQLAHSWQYQESDGSMLGQKITPLDRVGLYVPGGKAAYPSSLIMNAVPAKVAGVKEVVMVVPTPNGEYSEPVYAAASLLGVDRVFSVGGAQAIAALAYGTATIPKVDKIVGPGNRYVAAAKRAVFGKVGIDMIAGPSEVLIIADGTASADWVAMDMFAQAEHDEQAQSILIALDDSYIAAVQASIERLLPTMPRRDIIAQSLQNRGLMVKVQNLEEAAAISNRIAPEHLELAIADPDALLPLIDHAGAIFMGIHSAEVLGDYCAGPNHVLPTSGTARFSSPLGVYDFQKRSSLIRMTAAGAADIGRVAATLAEAEGLSAHATSARYRIDAEK